MASLRPGVDLVRRRRPRVLLGLGAIALVLLVGAPAAYAATITVNTSADELNADGDCSLREAIQAANTDAAVDACAAGSGTDTIVVPAGTYAIAIAGTGENANTTGDFDLSTDLSIAGSGAATTVVDGSDLDRVFHVVAGSAAISGLTIRNGTEPGGGGVFNEGSALVLTDSVISDNVAAGPFPTLGGGILNTSPLTLTRTLVTGNTTGNWGGGIYNDDTVTLLDSTVSANSTTADSAENRGGGIFNSGTLDVVGSTIGQNIGELFGGGIWNTGTATLTDSTVSGNSAPGPPNTVGVGGGAYNQGTMTLTAVSVSANTASQAGGFANSGTLTLIRSTVDHNTADSSSGAMDNYGGTVTIVNSTVSGNAGWAAGGLRNFGGTASVANSTFAENTGIGFTGFATGAIKNEPGYDGIVNLAGSILANSPAFGDCLGVITSQGYNLIEDPSSCTVVGDTTGNITGVDPLLGPLADNGGPTKTHALLVGSPAIDTGSPSCPPPATDQRGINRPQGSRCDIGAFELEQDARIPQHFLRYQLNQPEALGETVTLVDQFGTMTVRLEEAEWLLNPAEKQRTGRDPEPIQRADEHLVCYGLPYMSTADRTVTVENQFVHSTLRVGRPLTLCTPASKTPSGDPGPPPGDLDHFVCYDVRGETPLFPSETMVVRDQFGQRTVRIDRARELCNPAEKRREGHDPEPILRPDEHLVCYRITTQTPSFAPLRVIANDQFHTLQTLRVRILERLCVPSTAQGPATG